jgi:transcription initiation factor IIE alpha subunit
MEALTTKDVKKMNPKTSIRAIEDRSISVLCKRCATRIWFMTQFTADVPKEFDCPVCGSKNQ